MAATEPLALRAASWSRLKHGEDKHCFARHRAYQMRWDRVEAELTSYMSAAALNGGPIALLAGNDLVGGAGGGGGSDSCGGSSGHGTGAGFRGTVHGVGGGGAAQLRVFTASGEPLGAWAWEHTRCLRMGWTSSHELLCVLECGRVLLWSMHGERIAEFGLGAACEGPGLLMAEVRAQERAELIPPHPAARSHQYSEFSNGIPLIASEQAPRVFNW